MREFWEIYPIILPSPQIEVRWELRRAWEVEQYKELPKLWQDHINSINEFKDWKARHHNDGTMTKLYEWSPYLIAGISILSCNPLMMVIAYKAFCDRVDLWRADRDY